MKILFLLKRNLISGGGHSVIAKSGLLNSARITAHQLQKHLHVDTEIEICDDANEIDKFLHKHRPRVCVIEALWVTPAKMQELAQLHRRVGFVVLIHSEVPFLANEGIAIEWIWGYNDIDRVFPAFNSELTYDQFKTLGIVDLYLPNVYLDVDKRRPSRPEDDCVIDIGCFGAIRPFKNQLIQAMAAIAYANKNELTLLFHMNCSRVEQNGEAVIKNIRALFANSHHKLVEHGWCDRDDFLLLISGMDVGLQVSMTESFNIIAADFVNENVPIVVGKTISWMPDSQMADTEDMDDIVDKIGHSINNRNAVNRKSVRALTKYNKDSLKQWEEFLSNFH